MGFGMQGLGVDVHASHLQSRPLCGVSSSRQDCEARLRETVQQGKAKLLKSLHCKALVLGA